MWSLVQHFLGGSSHQLTDYVYEPFFPKFKGGDEDESKSTKRDEHKKCKKLTVEREDESIYQGTEHGSL